MLAPTKDEEDELESSKAPLLEHLVELRNRLIYSLWAFFLTFIICFFFSKNIYTFLTQPLANALAGQERNMIFTALYEAFFTQVKVAMWGEGEGDVNALIAHGFGEGGGITRL